MEMPYNARNKPAPIQSVRPYRPVVFNRNSHTRFERNRTGELLRHLGRPASFPEMLLIGRIVSIEWWLLKTDARIDAGIELSGHDIRGRLAGETRLHRDLVTLGIQPPKPVQMDATEYLRMKRTAETEEATPAPPPVRKGRPPRVAIVQPASGAANDVPAIQAPPLAAAAPVQARMLLD